MADEIETALNSMIERAPVTPTLGDDDFQQTPVPGEAPQAEAKPAEKTEEETKAGEGAKEGGVELPEIDQLRKKFSQQQSVAAEERAKRRQIEAQAQAYQEQLQMLQQQFEAQQARQRAARFKVPDPEENVIEAVKYERAVRLAQERQQQQAYQAQQEQMQQLNYVNRLKTGVEDLEAEFREQNPDYDEHADFVVDFEQQRLEMMGVPKAQAEQMAINWAINAADMMMKQGVNPAKAAYEQAKRMGFKPKAAAAAEAAGAKHAQQKAGQDASRTLSGGGAGAGTDMSLQRMSGLKGAAFDSAFEKWYKGS